MSRGRTIPEAFARQVSRAPGAVAVISGGESWSYGELAAAAHRVARHLQDLALPPEAPVGVCLGRSPRVPAVLLGLLEAGAAFVPLDPGTPPGRLARIVERAEPRLLIVDRRHEHLVAARCPRLVLEAEWPLIELRPPSPVEAAVAPESLAYVIFTSGSTGEPKGIVMSHAGVTSRAARTRRRYRIGPGDRVLHLASLGFDLAVWEVFIPLLTGAGLVLGDPDRVGAPGHLRELVARQRVTVARFVPPVLQRLLEVGALDGCEGLRQVITGGDRLTARLVERFLAGTGAELYNQYGPSERPSSIAWRCRRGAAAVPIGAPLPGTSVHLLDDRLEPLADGEAGEVFLGGEGLARGYLRDPRATAERFLPDPGAAVPGARMYRTGDLARALPDGALDFLGRLDSQVKVHGVRVELAEVERRLLQIPEVAEAAVVAADATGDDRNDRGDRGDRELVAYLVGGGRRLEPEAVRTALGADLPPAMLPRHVVWLDAMPLGATGKIDRLALRARPLPALTAATLPAPEGALERSLWQAWRQCLGRDDVGVRDNFFELGGTSLDALELAWRLQESTGVPLLMSDLLAEPTIAGLARVVERRREAEGAVEPGPAPLPRQELYGLAPAQRRLWLFDQTSPRPEVYNVGRAQWLEGRLDAGRLAAAVDRLVARHDVLRARFPVVGGGPRLEIRPRLDGFYEHRDLRALPAPEAAARRLLVEALRTPLCLDRDPLLRVRLLRVADDRWAFLFVVHHIVCDGWSLDVIMRDLSELYESAAEGREADLPVLAVQYQDYAAWHEGLLRTPEAARHRAYWRAQLADPPPPLDLPADRPRRTAAPVADGRVRFALSRRLSSRLHDLARRQETTWAVCLLAAVGALLHRSTGRSDVVVGTVGAGRAHRALRHQVGFFVTTLALRQEVAGDRTFADLVGRVKRTFAAAHQHDLVPFDQVVSDMGIVGIAPDATRKPLFDVVVLFEQPHRRLDVAGVASRPLEVPAGSDSELTLVFKHRGERIEGELVYDAGRFARARVERLCRHLRRLVAAATAAPAIPIAALDLLGEAEVLRLRQLGTGGPAAPGGRASIVDELAAVAASHPEAPAVVHGDVRLTYGELERRADLVARWIEAAGAAPEDRIGVLMGRSDRLVTALLGVLAAGCAYVPIDPEWPAERIGFVLADAGCRGLLTDPGLRACENFDSAAARSSEDGAQLSEPAGRVREHRPQPTRHSAKSSQALSGWAAGARGFRLAVSDRLLSEPPPARAGRQRPLPEQLACVIYTSGSTGVPKGVMIEHRSLVDLARWHRRSFAVGPGSRAMLYTSIAFDAASYEVWSNLLAGACLYPIDGDERKDPRALAGFVRAHAITHACIPTGVLMEIWRSGLLDGSGLTVFTGGDRLGELTGRRFRVVNSYGPTEATVTATCFDLAEPAAPGAPPVGRPVSGVEVLVLDRRGGLRPLGARGEIAIGGAGVSRGYLARPDLTAERFVPHPWKAGERLYRTGDLGRWDERGLLHCLGREDDQVKVRGFRIELGEIEQALRGLPGVEDAAVVPRRGADGEARLIAWVVGSAEPAELAARLAARLPGYMLPHRFLRLEALPRTANGKVDRRSLLARPLPDRPLPEIPETAEIAPRTPTERALIAICEGIVETRPIGAGTDFFAAGGSSLRAMRLTMAIQERCGVELPIAQVWRTPVLGELAAAIDRLARQGGRDAGDGPLVLLREGGGARLFLMPTLFGAAVALRELAAAIAGRTVLGLDAAPWPDAPARYADAVDAAQPQGEIVLAGYSVGGNIAFELARELARRGRAVSDLVMLDSARRLETPRLDRETLERWAATLEPLLPGASAAAILADPDGDPGDPERLVIQRSRQVLEHWCAGADAGTIQATIHFVTADDTPPRRIEQWRGATAGRLRIYRGFGEHLAMLDGANARCNGELIARILGASRPRVTAARRRTRDDVGRPADRRQATEAR